MGMKKLARKRLHDVERKGINVDIGSGPGIKNAIISATQHREGFKVITDILVDLGTSKDTIKTGGATENFPVGAETDAGVSQLSYIGQLTEAVFGVVTQVEAVCLEMPSDGKLLGSTTNTYKLIFADATGKIGNAPSSIATVNADMDSIGVFGEHSLTKAGDGDFLEAELANKYMYITTGAATPATEAATASITVNDDFSTDQLDTAVTRIVVIATDGTVVEHIFDSGTAKGSSTSGTIGYDGTPTLAEMATSIAAAIDNHAKFNASATDKVVNITQNTAGVAGNTTITLVNGVSATGAALTASLTIADFAGGTTAGTSTAMISGKFLIRVTGFIAPDDL